MAPTAPAEMPIFRDNYIEELAKRTGYAPAYLLKVKEGQFPVTARFRRKMAAILRQSEEELFGPPDAGAA